MVRLFGCGCCLVLFRGRMRMIFFRSPFQHSIWNYTILIAIISFVDLVSFAERCRFVWMTPFAFYLYLMFESLECFVKRVVYKMSLLLYCLLLDGYIIEYIFTFCWREWSFGWFSFVEWRLFDILLLWARIWHPTSSIIHTAHNKTIHTNKNVPWLSSCPIF